MNASFEEVILLTMPFADELIEWCKTHPDFRNALKIIYDDRFIHIGTVVITRPKSHPQDEVIGVYAYDYKMKHPLFKQDFIVNKNKEYKEFILYTRNPKGQSRWVKDISEFYSKYAKNGDYINSHHVSYGELPTEAKGFALRAVRLARKRSKYGYVRPSQDVINEIFQQVKAERQKAKFGIEKF